MRVRGSGPRPASPAQAGCRRPARSRRERHGPCRSSGQPRTVPGTMLWTLIPAGGSVAMMTSRAGMRTRSIVARPARHQRHEQCAAGRFEHGQRPLAARAAATRAASTAAASLRVASGRSARAADPDSGPDASTRPSRISASVSARRATSSSAWRHVEDRQVERRFQPGEIGQDLRLALGVEAGRAARP